MFLQSKYILANELTTQMNIHLANISTLRKQYRDNDDMCTIKRLNSCLFINTESHKLPRNIKEGIKNFNFADISNKLPTGYVQSEFNVQEQFLEKSGIVTAITKIAGKRFYVFDWEFVERIKGSIPYILDAKDYEECLSNKTIKDGIKLKENKYFTWY